MPSSKIDRRYTYDSLVRAFENSEQIRANIRGNTAPKYNPSNQVDKLQKKQCNRHNHLLRKKNKVSQVAVA